MMQKVIIPTLIVFLLLLTASARAQTGPIGFSSFNFLTEFKIGSASFYGIPANIDSPVEKIMPLEQWINGGFTQLVGIVKERYATSSTDNISKIRNKDKFPWYIFPFSKATGKSHLTPTQNNFVKASGYPQQFIKSFGIKDGKDHVVEIWTYISLGIMSSFINGKYFEDNYLEDFDPSLPSGELHPEDYDYMDTPETIVERHGRPLRLEKGQTWMGETEVYGYSNAAFSFVNGRLKSVAFSSKYLNGRQWYSDR